MDSQRWVRCAAFLLTTTPNSLVSGARAGKIVIAVGKTLASLVSYRSASSNWRRAAEFTRTRIVLRKAWTRSTPGVGPVIASPRSRTRIARRRS